MLRNFYSQTMRSTLRYLPTKDWTLFLDRDGVINHRLENDYVKSPDGFLFLEGVLESIAYFSAIFGKIIVVTNQQGIGKGLMTVAQLDLIHDKMLNEVKHAHGRIDKVFFCPDLEASGSFNRKPMIGMGLMAKRHFPEIQFRRSIMVGDSISDMCFGTRLKMHTVLIASDTVLARSNMHYIDYCFQSLPEFSGFLRTLPVVVNGIPDTDVSQATV